MSENTRKHTETEVETSDSEECRLCQDRDLCARLAALTSDELATPDPAIPHETWVGCVECRAMKPEYDEAAELDRFSAWSAVLDDIAIELSATIAVDATTMAKIRAAFPRIAAYKLEAMVRHNRALADEPKAEDSGTRWYPPIDTMARLERLLADAVALDDMLHTSLLDAETFADIKDEVEARRMVALVNGNYYRLGKALRLANELLD